MKKFRIFIFLSLIACFLLAFVGCSTSLEAPTDLKIDQDTLVLTWSKNEDANFYTLDINGVEYSSNKNSYKLEKLDAGDYVIKVRAMGAGRSKSDWSEKINFTREQETGMLFKLINGGTEYEVMNAGTVEGDVVVPATYRNRPVTSIGKKAFTKKVKIKSIQLPNSITNIGESAFSSCEFLETINIPSGVTQIGKKAFQSCSSLVSDIVIPEGVTVIEDSTFGYCRSLKSVTIGSKVTSIGESAFADCVSLEKIIIPNNVTEIGRYAFSACSSATELTISDNVTYLPEAVFANCVKLTDVTLGVKVQQIGPNAFSGCAALPSFTMTDSVVSVEKEAFRNCTSLADVTVSENLTNIGLYAFLDTKIWTDAAEVVYVGDWLVGCKVSNLASYAAYIKNTTVGISVQAFAYCSEATSIILPNSVKYINMAAFGAMSKLASVVIGSGVEIIGQQAFAYCSVLKNVILGSYDFDVQKMTDSSLKRIDAYAFMKCELLSSIEIPETVESIGGYAFRNTAMYSGTATGVVYADNWVVDCNPSYLVNENVTVNDGTVGVAEYAFSAVQGLSSVVLPESVKAVNTAAFRGSESLLKVTLPSTLQRIEPYTFFGCTYLLEVNLPETLTYIGRSAFGQCYFLGAALDGFTIIDAETELVIPDSVKEIGDYAFYSCGYAQVTATETYTYGFDKIVLGSGLEKVGTEAFAMCQSFNTLVIGDNLTKISDYMFYQCISLKNIVFGAKVEMIDNRAFYGCTGLTSVTIPDTVKTIEKYAFYKCSNLQTLNLGNGVETIGRSAFASCSKIESLYIPASVKTITKQAFRGVSSLKSVVITSNVAKIENYAFYGCKLVTFYVEAETQPTDWEKRWNSSYRPVVWGVTLTDEGYVKSFTKTATNIQNVNDKTLIQVPLRDGYKCLGWATSATPTTAEYVGNDVLNAPDGTVLYAVWQPIAD